MRLAIRHTTAYRYSRSVGYAIQTLRLTPRTYDGLSVLRWQVRGERNRALPAFTDGFGNVVHTNAINRPHDSVLIAVSGEVVTRATDGLVRDTREPLPPGYFLRATTLTEPAPTLAAFAEESARGSST